MQAREHLAAKTGEQESVTFCVTPTRAFANVLLSIYCCILDNRRSRRATAFALPRLYLTFLPPPDPLRRGFSLPGIGLEGAAVLAASGDWHVIMAVRSYAKAEAGAKDLGMDPSTYTVMNLDLASLNSVRNFAAEIKAAKVKVDALVCNAAVWHPKVCACVLCVPTMPVAVSSSNFESLCSSKRT